MNDAMPHTRLQSALEAILMVTDTPISTEHLASVLQQPIPEVVRALSDLAENYRSEERGFELRELGEGWRYYSHPDFADVVEAFVRDGQTARLTKAALETLAIVAYRQPVSRGRIASIRGVNVDGVVRTLLTRGLVEEAGRDEETGAVLYQTTSYFLERIGIRDVTDLPPLAPYLPDAAAVETLIEGEQ